MPDTAAKITTLTVDRPSRSAVTPTKPKTSTFAMSSIIFPSVARALRTLNPLQTKENRQTPFGIMESSTQQTEVAMTELREAAQAALDAHDELRRVHEHEPELDEDNLPVRNREPWLKWHAEESKPAFAAWSKTMDRLEELLGDEFPGRHPFSFRPVCERILADEPARPL